MRVPKLESDAVLTGPEGVEPPLTVLETVVLPLNYEPSTKN